MRNPLFLCTLALVATVSSTSGFAQTNTTNSSPTPPAVSTSNAESKTSAAPVPGKNSFTEAEAKKRLESFGYTGVSALHQDAQSIWRGTATKGGQQMPVALDFQGNIVSK
jgi:putative membrane protein